MSYTDFSGLWQGHYTITECNGERDCWFRVGSTRPYLLRLRQNGAAVTGVLEAWWFAADVSGEVKTDGTLTLVGFLPGTSGRDGIGAVHVNQFSAHLDARQGLTGAIAYSVEPRPATESGSLGVVTHTGVVTGGTRDALSDISPLALAAYEGTWTGMYAVESCSFSGWRDCYPEVAGGAYTFTLALRVNGDSLTGDLQLPSARIPVSARITEAGLAVTGFEEHVVSGGTSVIDVLRWSTIRDAYARLNGTFDYDARFLRSSGDPYSSHYAARLMGVTLRP